MPEMLETGKPTAEEAGAAASAAAAAHQAAKGQPATALVVMTGRRPWAVGESIGLSQGYSFEPGVPVAVAEADAKLLVGKKDGWDGRHFERAGAGS